MHQSRNEQLIFKTNKVKELLERFAGIKNIKISPIVSGKSHNYRNKIILHEQNNKLGLYQEQSHSLVSIGNCLITDERINEAYQKIKIWRFYKNIIGGITGFNLIK